MDYVEIDAAGRQMMIAATELRKRFATTAAQLGELLRGWHGPEAAAVAADWDTTSTAAASWLDRMHRLGEMTRQVAGSTETMDQELAAEFRRSAQALEASMALFRRRRAARRRAAGASGPESEAL
jgi:uncharacterized protein YukE